MLTMSGVVNALSFVACLTVEGFWKPSTMASVARSLLREGMVAFAVKCYPGCSDNGLSSTVVGWCQAVRGGAATTSNCGRACKVSTVSCTGSAKVVSTALLLVSNAASCGLSRSVPQSPTLGWFTSIDGYWVTSTRKVG